MAFETTTDRTDPSASVVAACGELDYASAPNFEAGLNGVIDSGQRCVVADLTGLSFMDSSGISVLVKARTRLVADNGLLVVVCSDRGIHRKSFEVTGLVELLNLVNSCSEGMAVVRSFRAG